MKIIIKDQHGMGTMINPTFRCDETQRTITCARAVPIPKTSLIQLYDGSGYTICSIAKEDIVRIE